MLFTLFLILFFSVILSPLFFPCTIIFLFKIFSNSLSTYLVLSSSAPTPLTKILPSPLLPAWFLFQAQIEAGTLVSTNFSYANAYTFLSDVAAARLNKRAERSHSSVMIQVRVNLDNRVNIVNTARAHYPLSRVACSVSVLCVRCSGVQ